jgi:hypothetical protein
VEDIVKKDLWQKPLGIDLAKRAGEVQRLVFGCYGKMIHRSGYDPEDVLQEVYKGIEARNQGKCPWDERKSSFGHYVHMVVRCVLANYHRKASRIANHEQLGIMEGKERQMVDVASAAHLASNKTAFEKVEEQEALEDLKAYLAARGGPVSALAAKSLPLLLHKKASRETLAKELGVSTTEMARAVSFVREAAKEWASRP